jgi:hypothetical protein
MEKCLKETAPFLVGALLELIASLGITLKEGNGEKPVSKDRR